MPFYWPPTSFEIAGMFVGFVLGLLKTIRCFTWPAERQSWPFFGVLWTQELLSTLALLGARSLRLLGFETLRRSAEGSEMMSALALPLVSGRDSRGNFPSPGILFSRKPAKNPGEVAIGF